MYCILAHLHPELTDTSKIRKKRVVKKLVKKLYEKKLFSKINLIGYDYKDKNKNKLNMIKDVNLIEKLNPKISIFIYAVDEEEESIIPYRLSSKTNDNHDLIVIDLLLLHNELTNSYHYVLIKNLSSLVISLSTVTRKRFIDETCCRRLQCFI